MARTLKLRLQSPAAACTSAELELSCPLVLKCLLTPFPGFIIRCGTLVTRSSHQCFRILFPTLAPLSSGAFQGSPAHQHTCARTTSPSLRAEHPLHGVCFSLLPYLRTGWVQSAARLTAMGITCTTQLNQTVLGSKLWKIVPGGG